MTHVLEMRKVKRTFKERWLSWPWKPWLKHSFIRVTRFKMEEDETDWAFSRGLSIDTYQRLARAKSARDYDLESRN